MVTAPREIKAPVPSDIAITHVSVLDVERGTWRRDMTVPIAGNHIVEVAPAATVPLKGVGRIIDGHQKFLIPGLWDMHVHLGNDDRRALGAFIAAGVTSSPPTSPGQLLLASSVTCAWAAPGGVKNAEVIGIVADVRQLPDSAPGATTYVPSTQSPQGEMIVFVRTMRNAPTMANELRRAVHEIAPQLPVYDLQTMTQREGTATAQNRFRAMLLTAFALAALLLAAIGIYGVLSFAVTVRTREMGIRIALGAEPRSVQWLVLGEGLALVGLGIVIGLAGAFAGARVLRTFLFDLTPSDPVTYAAIIVVLGVTAVMASWVPGLRASRIDPVIALRAE